MSTSSLTRATLFDNVLVTSLLSVESGALSLYHISTLESFILRASSVSGTSDVKLEYITSPDGTNYESYSDTTDITSSTATDKPNNKEGFNPFFPPASAPMSEYIKLKVTGVNANPADTLVTCYAILREGEK